MDLIKCSLPNWLMLQVVSCHMHTSEMRMLTDISLDCHTLLAAWGRVCSWKNNLARKCLTGLSRFLNPANFIFRCSVGLVRCYSNLQKFLCSTVYSLPVIIGIRTLVGWCNILFTNASIPVLNTPWTWFFIRPFLTQPQGSRVQTMPTWQVQVMRQKIARRQNGLGMVLSNYILIKCNAPVVGADVDRYETSPIFLPCTIQDMSLDVKWISLLTWQV